ncbi:DNA mismatch repair protein mutS, putative [Perkinsus marinus ATCC 50983]|uniref:DNA mismatch repair protein mutS, putative n=1 Tax=Perkinsus marinus (strain ATCC 50983 / TXsc) TaxID=423536 RepID=C5K4X4_PERM5|nr:DNA mismatch repair protein mutS, putative [Perkinsus marinus ATCC 50983]EER20396.1 DNA mismatch repair protein mutS, putative [Perkinsus marinus ATCC 50983]|eukprot:XP_002788600.1 DNA mismatch repair protein mutS, putative [Perkinsus marinus ATCC 50983]
MAALEAVGAVLVLDVDKVAFDNYLIPEGFTQRNESGFIGTVRGDWSEVVAAREALLQAIGKEWPAVSEASVVYEGSCNTIALRRKPRDGRSTAFYHPTVGRGRGRSEGMSKYWTSKGVEAAASRYVAACDSATARARRMLRELCGVLSSMLGGLIAASHWSVVLTFAYLHTENSLRKGWTLAELTEGEGVRMDVKGLKPYWMESPPRGTARLNDFSLGEGSSFALITGCNESGKSTFLRSICALALTSNTGLFSPCAEGTAISRLTDLLVMFPRGDRPSEELSAHALECATLKVVDRDACRSAAKALVVVDEFGRATSPVDGAALTVSQLERFVAAGVACLWATHLQADVIRVLSPEVAQGIATWRMRVEDDALLGGDLYPSRKVTYKIESGVCSNSMGIYTANQIGLPSSMVSRAMQLRQMLVGEEVGTPLPERPVEVDLAEAILAVSSQGHSETLLHLSPDSMPPPLYQASSVVYVLALMPRGGGGGGAVQEYYVGETENLSKRLEQHRRRLEETHVITGIDCVLTRGKGEAQSIEGALIRHLQGRGARLISAHDGAHRGTAGIQLNGDV